MLFTHNRGPIAVERISLSSPKHHNYNSHHKEWLLRRLRKRPPAHCTSWPSGSKRTPASPKYSPASGQGTGRLWAESGDRAALAVAALGRQTSQPIVVVLPHPSDIDDFCDDFALFSPIVPERFPANETPKDRGDLSDDVEGTGCVF